MSDGFIDYISEFEKGFLVFKKLWLQMGASDSCQWLMPAIPATWEAENRRITVQGQPGQIVCKILSQK
jgi:hypothetical protein